MFDSVPDAVAAIRRGEMVVVLDDEGRELLKLLGMPFRRIEPVQKAASAA